MQLKRSMNNRLIIWVHLEELSWHIRKSNGKKSWIVAVNVALSA